MAWYEDFFGEDYLRFHLRGGEWLEERTLPQCDFVITALDLHPGARVLDLCCGQGRHSVELAKRGFTVTGLDLSEYLLDLARRRAREAGVAVNFVHRDMRELPWEDEFDAVVNLFTSFGYFDDNTNNDILRQCCSLVRPKGFFALEIMNRDWLVRNFQPRGFTWYKGLILLEDRKFDVETSRVQATWTFLKQQSEKQFVLEKQVTINTRLWSLHELVETFRKNGWEFQAAYPGFDNQDKSVALTEAQRLLFIARKK